jgi:hypothetical protein
MRSLFHLTLVGSAALALTAAWARSNEPESKQAEPAAAEAEDDVPPIKPELVSTATHELLKSVEVKGANGSALQTLAVTRDGKVVALVAPSRHAPIGVPGEKKSSSEIRLFDADGKELQRWPLPFVGHSVGVGPGGEIYAAGDGQIARYSAEGQLLVQVEAPHLGELKNEDAVRVAAEEQMKMQKQSVESMKNSKSAIEGILKNLEQVKPEKMTALQKSQVEAYREYLKNFDAQMEAMANPKLEDAIASITSRVRIINAIAANDKEVFIACGELRGYGFAVWRLNAADLSNPERIVTGLNGCCGQMDIQAGPDGVVVAENSRKRVARYDTSGKLVSSFGTSGRDSDGLSFGGCCNPMHCRVAANGDIFTSESEGIVKRFSDQGKFLGLVGFVKLSGGCKNVAVAVSPQADRVYLCDFPENRFVIFASKKAGAITAGGQ